jgi:hypothetical protein
MPPHILVLSFRRRGTVRTATSASPVVDHHFLIATSAFDSTMMPVRVRLRDRATKVRCIICHARLVFDQPVGDLKSSLSNS